MIFYTLLSLAAICTVLCFGVTKLFAQNKFVEKDYTFLLKQYMELSKIHTALKNKYEGMTKQELKKFKLLEREARNKQAAIVFDDGIDLSNV